MVGGQLELVGVQSYRQLIAWQKAMELVNIVYELIDSFPREEKFGLTQQILRAAVSVPSNIAEGQGRNSTREFIHHLSIAYGSLMETETQILIAEMRNYGSAEGLNAAPNKSAEVGRLINGLTNSLTKKLTTDH